MEQKILILAGSKQSGKSSAANFITGYTITQHSRRHLGSPMPSEFSIDDNGNLIVNSISYDANNKAVRGYGILDLNRKDDEFINYAEHCIWPYVKIYAFADTLKEIAIRVFGLTEKQVYGTDADKNSETNIKWKDFNSILKMKLDPDTKARNVTAREFLQYFGTNICRKIYNNCWIKSCFNQIRVDGYPFAIIQDARFSNEIEESKKYNAKVIRLLRSVDNDNHASEIGLNSVDCSKFDLVIDNSNTTVIEKNQLILDAMYEWQWFESHIGLEEWTCQNQNL